MLYVNLCFRSGTWAMSDMTASGTAQRFYLTFAANFLPLRQAEVSHSQPVSGASGADVLELQRYTA